jgi:hypothetical protein
MEQAEEEKEEARERAREEEEREQAREEEEREQAREEEEKEQAREEEEREKRVDGGGEAGERLQCVELVQHVEGKRSRQ